MHNALQVLRTHEFDFGRLIFSQSQDDDLTSGVFQPLQFERLPGLPVIKTKAP